MVTGEIALGTGHGNGRYVQACQTEPLAPIIDGSGRWKPLTVWLLQTGEPLHIDAEIPRPMRGMNLADALVKAGHRVVFWSSAFSHRDKRQRSHVALRINVSPKLQIRLIPSPGYVRNIGFGRLWDHAILARNLWQQLKQEKTPPDAAFIGFPPIEAAAVMSHWLAERGVATMLDIKDQWPTIFLSALPNAARPLARLACVPYVYMARRAMRDANALSSMAESFLMWGIDFAGRQRNEWDRVVPLTAPVGQVSTQELDAARRWWDDQGIVDNGRPRVCFVGSHSPAFDIEPIYIAARQLLSQGNPCEFIICGDGEASGEWRGQMLELSNVRFPGWVDLAKTEALAKRCQASIAPYINTDNFLRNVPNKVIDSLSRGLPILSPLQGEVANLIVSHAVGLRYGADSGKTLVECIKTLIDAPVLRKQMSKNAINLYHEKFSFEKVYGGLVKHLEALSVKTHSA